MAPEVMSSKQYGTAADMFSIGLILYELFHGAHPLAHLFNNRYVCLSLPFFSFTLNKKKKTVPLLVQALSQYQGEDVAEKNFPPMVKELIPRCCAHDQDFRPTAEDALQLLDDMLIEDDDDDGMDPDSVRERLATFRIRSEHSSKGKEKEGRTSNGPGRM